MTYRPTIHFLERGHRRIAMINGPTGRTFVWDREQGFRDALATHGITADPRLMMSEHFSEDAAFRFARSLLEQTPRRPPSSPAR